jgi:hypothetical protein
VMHGVKLVPVVVCRAQVSMRVSPTSSK